MFNIIKSITCSLDSRIGFQFTVPNKRNRAFKDIKFTDKNFDIDSQSDVHAIMTVIRELNSNEHIEILAGSDYYAKFYIYVLAEIFGKEYDLINEILYTNRKYLTFELQQYIPSIPDDRKERGALVHQTLRDYVTLRSIHVSKRIFGNSQELPFEYQLIRHDTGMGTRAEMSPTLGKLILDIINNEIQIFAVESRYILDKKSLKAMFDIEVDCDDDVLSTIFQHPLLTSLYIARNPNVDVHAAEYKNAVHWFYEGEESRDNQLVELLDIYTSKRFLDFDFHNVEFLGDLDTKYKIINMFIITNSKQGKWKRFDIARS